MLPAPQDDECAAHGVASDSNVRRMKGNVVTASRPAIRVLPVRQTLTLSAWAAALALAVSAATARAQQPDLSVWPPQHGGPETIYAPPGAPSASATAEPQSRLQVWPDIASCSVAYATDSVYRGVNRTDDEAPGVGAGGNNYQLQGRLAFGRSAARPFVEAFTNVNDADSESHLQEARLSGGEEWRLGNLSLAAGAASYVYPSRAGRNTNEIFGRMDLNDRRLWAAETAILSPHVLLAWDPDANKGAYAEAGIEHEWRTPVPELSLTLSAGLAYTQHLRESFVEETPGHGTGWQHGEIGLETRYRLNALLNLPRTQGEWAIAGFVYRDQHLAHATLGENVTWGGCRLEWRW